VTTADAIVYALLEDEGADPLFWKRKVAEQFDAHVWSWLSGQSEFMAALDAVVDVSTADIALHVGLNLETNRPRPDQNYSALRTAEIYRQHRATLQRKLDHLQRVAHKMPGGAAKAIARLRDEIAELDAREQEAIRKREAQ
jgi:hypothetical protein